MSAASASIGVSIHTLLTGSDAVTAEVTAAATAYKDGTAANNDEVRRVLDETLVAEVLESLKGKVDEIESLRRRCAAREQARLDYEAYFRQVRSLREKGAKGDKINLKERKLAGSKTSLESTTADLMWQMQSLLDRRATIVLPEFRTLLAAQTRFFADSSAQLAAVGAVPDVEPPAPRPRPTFTVPDVAGAAAAPAFSATLGGAGGASAVPSAPALSAVSETPPASAPAMPPKPPKPGSAALCKCRALYDYEPQGDDELKVTEGDVIEVLQKQDDGWWEGRLPSGKQGVFPSNYVEEI